MKVEILLNKETKPIRYSLMQIFRNFTYQKTDLLDVSNTGSLLNEMKI